jgi:1,4-dihydroxy-2-naphthoate octaprenyltransferase
LNVGINVTEVLYIFLVSIPSICGIANIMLANNICDLKADILNNRFTLPYYIGKPLALKIFKSLYYISYIDIVVLIILKMLPLASIFVLLTFIIVNKNIKLFEVKQIKNENFILAIKNFVLMNATQVAIIGITTVILKF